MKKYSLTGLLFVLIALWSLIFGIYKYFFWGYFKTEALRNGVISGVTLESIAANLSIGAMIAFGVGSILFTLYKERRILRVILGFSVLIIAGYLVFGGKSESLFTVLTILFGVIYALWSIIRNILISMEIERTGLHDTFINGVSNIAFIIFLIAGSIFGGILMEKFGDFGSIGLLGLLVLTTVSVFFARYSKDDTLPSIHDQIGSFREYSLTAPRRLYVAITTYGQMMLPAAILLVIATLVSQKAIDYSVSILHIEQSSATLILLYSAVGSILGNVVSMRVHTHRWTAFTITLGSFALLMGAAPYFFENFVRMSVFAFFAGVFFGAAYNFIESYFFVRIAQDNNKADGAVAYGIVCSITMATCMYGVDILFPLVGYSGVFYVIAVGLLLLTTSSAFASKKWK